MFQNPCKTLGYKKNMVYKIPPGGGEVNHIQPVAYKLLTEHHLEFLSLKQAAQARLSLHMSKYCIVGNHTIWLNY